MFRFEDCYEDHRYELGTLLRSGLRDVVLEAYFKSKRGAEARASQ